MDFFKSVFSDEAEDSNPQTTPTLPQSDPNPNPDPTRDVSSGWSSLLKSIASKSESVIDTYRRDLEEFRSGLRRETEVIRQAVHDLPGSLEAGAAVAQEKLEFVGQVFDDFTDIIVRNKGLIGVEIGETSDDSSGNVGVKAYSRVDALVRGVECDLNTYCNEVDEVEEFEGWRKGFVLEDRVAQIQEVVEGNGVVREIFDEVVPGKVSEGVFWERLFFRVWKVRRAEEARSRLVRRAITGEEEEEELSWDVDEEEFEECEERTLQRGDVVQGQGGDLEVEEIDNKVEEVESSVEKVVLEGKTDSDISVISSQLSPEEEDLGWDEIEDIGSGDDEHKVSTDKADLRKRLSAVADEDLTWDIEDDDEPVKS